MDIPWRSALLVVAAAFFVFLLAKMIPRRGGAVVGSTALSEAKARLRAAASDRERAAALCDAGAAALALPFGATRAAAYFLRAMRLDPAWPEPVERAVSALTPRRSRLLERMLWRRLAATPWDAAHAAVLRSQIAALASVSKNSRGHAAHAKVFDRILGGDALRLP